MATLVSVALDPPSATGAQAIPEGDSLTFDAIGTYDDASTRKLGPYEVTFASSDTTVLQVVNTEVSWGLCYGISPGSATLTATTTGGLPALSDTAAVSVSAEPPGVAAAPTNRFSLAFASTALANYPVWTAIDDHPNLVTSYTIDRGRSYELDQFDTGRATVTITDPDGILDPTNPTGPYHGQIKPLLRAGICRRNPVTNTWWFRFHGFVEDYTYTVDPSGQLNRLTISLVDLFEVCSSAEMQPGQFGTNVKGQVGYPVQTPDDRILDVLADLKIPYRLRIILPGSVQLQKTTYSPGESPLTVIQEAADGEFPGVANVFCDRRGRLCFRGRKARFDPEGVSADVGFTQWDYHTWDAGDGATVNLSPGSTAHVRTLEFQRGLSKLVNSAVATPAGIADDKTDAQRVTDTASIGQYGIRSWSATGLLTYRGDLDRSYPTNALTETKRFATFYVHNYHQPRDRINQIAFRSMHPDDPRAPANWDFINRVDIGDTVQVTVANAGGGGFTSAAYFVEGISEEAKAATPEYDDVTVTLDLSPRAYYAFDPWGTPLTSPDATWTAQRTSTSGHPKPTVHGGDHVWQGADPMETAFDNVGTPLSDYGTGGGAGDLTGYIHYGDNPSGPVGTAGGPITINTTELFKVTGLGGPGELTIDNNGVNIVYLNATGANGAINVTGTLGIGAANMNINAYLTFYGTNLVMPNLPQASSADRGVIYRDSAGYLHWGLGP